jgi:hypothetical protein
MKIKKYSDYNNQEINESFWQDVKYGISKLGRYKAGGKILGKGKVTKQAQSEVEEILKKETNKVLKELYDVVKSKAPEFPNDKRKITFLRGIIMYGQFYDSVVAAGKKDPNEEGYLSPEICNEIITDLRKIVKKHLDVDLAAVYSVMESKDSQLSDDEIMILNSDVDFINEEILGKLGQLKDKAMDKLFGAKKGSDAPQKTSTGQSAKLQKTSGETNVESDRMKTLQSNKLPLVLAGIGATLGALGWLAQTEWMKNFIIDYFGPDKIITDAKEIATKISGGAPDSKGLVNWMSQISQAEGGGQIKTAGDVTKFIDKFGGVENMKGFFIGNNGGDPLQQAELLQKVCSGDPSASVGSVFTKAAGMYGNMKGGQNLFGISTQANFVGTAIKTQITKTVVKGAGTAVAAKVAGVGVILSTIGLTLVATGAVVKLMREKGQRQSRAKTLNDLLQSLQFVKVDKSDESEDLNPGSGVVEISEKSLYPTMIKNLTSLRGILLNQDNVKLDGEKNTKSDIVSGRLYNYTNKAGKKSVVKVLSVTHDTRIGKDKVWLTKDDEKMDTLKKGYASVIFPDSDGKYTSKSRELAVLSSQLQPVKESISQILLEKDRLGKGANVEVTKQETYLTQAVQNTRKSLKSLQDEKDKGVGITIKFIDDILEKKMETSTKEPVKNLYKEIYEYLHGSKSKTLSDLGVLYKESVDIISKASSRQVVAEKMARFSKRTMQFEGEGFYSGLGKFGDYVEEYNSTLKQIMDYYKSKKNEKYVFNFSEYKKNTEI